MQVTLTDLHPNLDAFAAAERERGGLVRARRAPVSALEVPPELTGLRTLFTALHHFPPEQARCIFADAVAQRRGIAVFEPLNRSPLLIVLLFLQAIIRGLVLTPFIGRLSAARLLFTYVVPLGPLIIALASRYLP